MTWFILTFLERYISIYRLKRFKTENISTFYQVFFDKVSFSHFFAKQFEKLYKIKNVPWEKLVERSGV